MAIENVLVAYDESDGAKRALEVACELASANPKMHLDIVYVVPIPLIDDHHAIDFKEILDMMVDDGKKVLEEAVESIEGVGDDQIDTLIITGTNPASELVKLAQERKHDMIVIGSRGLKGMKEYLGSVSHKVLSLVDVPVLVAK